MTENDRVTDLPVDAVRRGRPPKTAYGDVIRSLTEDDLALLKQERGVRPQPIKALREAHHSIARLIAEGRPNYEVASLTGYSQSRISILKVDPAFQELVEHYRGRVEELRDFDFEAGAARAKAIRDRVFDEIEDRLEDAPHTFCNADLRDLAKDFMDRTGLGPASKSTNVNVNIDYAERVARGRLRAATVERPHSAEQRTVIEYTAEGDQSYHRIEHEPGRRETE